MKKQTKVLIVEGHRNFAQILKGMIQWDRSVQPVVTVTANLEAAELMMADNSMDLVFLDMGLAAQAGQGRFEAFVDDAMDVPVVAVGGPNDFQSMISGLDLGAWDCLFRNLISAGLIRNYLARARERSEQLHGSVTEAEASFAMAAV